MTQRQQRKIKLFKIRYNLNKPCCFSCGCIDYKIEFHHMDSSTKCFNPSQAKNFQEFFKETEKCIPLCRDCHRELHSLNGGTKKQITYKETIDFINRQV